MSIIIDEFRVLENELINNVLYFALGDYYSEEIANAKYIFRKMLDENNYSLDEKNFTYWLLWDYRIKNGNNFFQEYKRVCGNKLSEKQYKMLEGLSNTYLSIYEITSLKEGKKLTDIFSKKEILVKEGSETLNNNNLLIGRIVELDGQNYFLDECSTLDKRFINAIEKGFYEKFEEYKKKNRICSIEEFIRSNSVLVNSFTNIIDDIRKKQIEIDNKYDVYQSNYAVLDYEKLCTALSRSPNIEFDYNDDRGAYYIMYEEKQNRVLSEIVLAKNKLELECVSNKDSDDAKKVIEDMAGEYIKYMNDEVVVLDDIL
ncbi:hypothetical protein [Paramaledivibacter caminithermalis]|jgi:hypothetical protein|uniref:Uncharacterized protein n=1 Tax=Paramaledivibacter caminithermalis (strain DSM 15212 / CIP 107654 / DViRD3) TaxID=1121301 RepID=A0A1M6M5Y8_PARC5|nr:hypothetical protein [Paramaledivibacter caminithermalis]SHJ78869.1 hypothetical protein SAMN02745912_01072 [Paramaledivibacter caminithermalis DSM 15212]